MTIKTIIAVVVACLIAVLSLAFNRAANHLVAVSEEVANVEYARGSALSGEAFVQLNTEWKPVWLSVEWNWCPSLNPLRWCVEFDGDTAEGEAKVGTNGSKLYISDAIFSTAPVEMVFAGFVTTNASIEGSISKASVQNAQDLSAIEELQATIMLSDIDAFGFDFKNHGIDASREAGSDFIVEIKGEEASGMAKAAVDGSYSATLSLTPPDSVSHMIKLPKNPDGSYRYEVSGTLPVMH